MNKLVLASSGLQSFKARFFIKIMERYKACCSCDDSSCFNLDVFKNLLISLSYVIPNDVSVFKSWSNESFVESVKRLTINGKFKRAENIYSGPSYLSYIFDMFMPSAIISESDSKMFVSINFLYLSIVHKKSEDGCVCYVYEIIISNDSVLFSGLKVTSHVDAQSFIF